MTFCMCVSLFDGNKHCVSTRAVEIAIIHFTSSFVGLRHI